MSGGVVGDVHAGARPSGELRVSVCAADGGTCLLRFLGGNARVFPRSQV